MEKINDMTREQVIDALQDYFNIRELVSHNVYNRFGEASWQFLDTDFLKCVLLLRTDILNAPMTCNHDSALQRGLRCNVDSMVKEKKVAYLSAHMLGKAADFDVKGMTAEEARKKIKANADKFPCNVRIEAGKSWLHFDVLPQWGIKQKVYEFKV